MNPELKDFLNDVVLKEYDLSAEKVYPLKDGCKIETRHGPYFLKTASVTQEEIIFANEAQQWLIRKGFKQFVPLMRSKYNDPFVQTTDQLYYLTGWIKGKGLQLGRRSHLQTATLMLAEMHAAAKGFQPSIKASFKTWGYGPDWLSQRLLDLEIALEIAESRPHPSEFDLLFRSGAREIMALLQGALLMLINAPYLEIVEQTQKKGMLCHGDYRGQNLLRTRKGGVYLTHFDNCCLAVRMFDLGHFLLRVLPAYAWDFELAISLLRLYEKSGALVLGEAEILLAILSFPQPFWQIACQYYLQSGAVYSEAYQRRLEKIFLELPLQQEFIKEFARYYALGSVISPASLRSPGLVL